MKTAAEIAGRRRELEQRLDAVHRRQERENTKPIDARNVYYLIFLQREAAAWNAALEQLDWVVASGPLAITVSHENAP